MSETSTYQKENDGPSVPEVVPYTKDGEMPPPEPPVPPAGDGNGHPHKHKDGEMPPPEPPVPPAGDGNGHPHKHKNGEMPPAEPPVPPAGDGNGHPHKHKNGEMPPPEPPAGMPDDHGHHHHHHHHHTDGGTPPAGMPGGHDDCPVNEGIVVDLEGSLFLEEFNVEEDFVILSKEIFTSLESEAFEDISEEEFAVAEEGLGAGTTGAVFVFAADGSGGGSLFYDANGTDAGFGDGGEVLDIAQITGNADGITVQDLFVIA